MLMSYAVLLRKPPRELTLLMSVGLVDLVSTMVLYSLGLVVELNPIMRPLLQNSLVLFAAVKIATLLAAYVALQLYRSVDEQFVRKAALTGALAYILVWVVFASAGAMF